MASIILAAGALGYERVQKSRIKRREKKEETAARFSELEKENAERIARLQSQGLGQDQRQPEKYVDRECTGSSGSETSRRNSLAEEGPPPPGYEEAVRDRKGRGKS